MLNMNTNTSLTVRQAERAKRMRFNPLGSLKVERLSQHLDAFEAGHLREAANIWEHLEQRDELIRAVVAKRKKSIARQGFTVVMEENLTEAQKVEAREHAAALEFFYRNLEC